MIAFLPSTDYPKFKPQRPRIVDRPTEESGYAEYEHFDFTPSIPLLGDPEDVNPPPPDRPRRNGSGCLLAFIGYMLTMFVYVAFQGCTR